MNCPSPIAEILLKVIQTGILRIRAAAWAGNNDQADLEADHIHNLPDLLARYSIQKLDYYWNVERPCFERAITGLSQDSQLAELWERLRPLIEKELRSASSQSPTKPVQSRAS